MKILFSLLIILVSADWSLSTCTGTCRTHSKCYVPTPKCGPMDIGRNKDLFSVYFKEDYNQFNREIDEFRKARRVFKERYEDEFNFLLTYSKEQEEFRRQVKENEKSYKKEVEKIFNNGSSGYTERIESSESRRTVKESGSSSSTELNIQGEGSIGKYLAMTTVNDEDPAFIAKLLSRNPTNLGRSLILYNPLCSGQCGLIYQGLYSIWYLILNKCWAYFFKKLRALSCGQKKFKLYQYLRRLCRNYSFNLRRAIKNYFDMLYRKHICYW